MSSTTPFRANLVSCVGRKAPAVPISPNIAADIAKSAVKDPPLIGRNRKKRLRRAYEALLEVHPAPNTAQLNRNQKLKLREAFERLLNTDPAQAELEISRGNLFVCSSAKSPAKSLVVSVPDDTVKLEDSTYNTKFNAEMNVTLAKKNLKLRFVPENELGPRHSEKIRFSTGSADLDIVITNPAPKTYHDCGGTITANNISDKEFWHMVIIHHGQKYTKAEILKRLFEIAGPSDFYPVCYTQSKQEDYFLISKCRTALLKLFHRNLRIDIGNDTVLLTVKLEMAPIKLGQINPLKVFNKAIANRMLSLVTCEGVTNVLNLDNFASSPELTSIEIDLSNLNALQLFCGSLDAKLGAADCKPLNGIKLSNNNMISWPVNAPNMQKMKLQLIDLRNNKIDSIDYFKSWKKYTFSELFIQGNPVTRVVNYISQIRVLFPTLERLDGVYSKTVAAAKVNNSSKTVPIQFQGEIYDASDREFNERIFRKYKTSTRWHQVIVHHEGKFNQTEVLDAIFEIVAMNDFYPCYYRNDETYDTFFVRECYEPLELLYQKKLQLKFPASTDIINITLKMNVSDFKAGQVQPAALITAQINKRFYIGNKALDLSNFENSVEFEDFLCRLSNPRTFSIVISQASRRFLSNVEVLKLNDNGIRSARGTHSLVWMKALREIDLSNNNITDISALESIPKGEYTDIWLQGNPFCSKYEKAQEYFEAIKAVIPSLEKLDGRDKTHFDSINAKQNFICKLTGYDFVEQFVEHYFTVFDSFSRYNLIKPLYHPVAIVTMSCNFQGMPEHLVKTFSQYIDNGRNLIRNVGADPLTNVIFGQENVANFWSSFRQTKHDLRSFTVDLTSYTSRLAVITINGVFKENRDTVSDHETILGFSRTFVLKQCEVGLGLFKNSEEFQIINEIVLYYRPSSKQITNAFKIPIGFVPNDTTDQNSTEDNQCLMIVFSDLTGLNSMWCKRLLETSAWNIKEALESFVELATNYQIPEQAYVFNKLVK